MLAWRDVLHEGPVPMLAPTELRGVRARFIASQGWAPRRTPWPTSAGATSGWTRRSAVSR
ncbi:MAG TPA: hypothetical protein VES79_08320 [Solirubrobacteraceae bacterium]|nr:hypothetical protein [Solirubrobacteraceae bacterium]